VLHVRRHPDNVTSGPEISGGVEDAGLQTPPAVDRDGALPSPTLPAVLFAIQCTQPRDTSVIRAPDSQCFCYFTCYCSYTDPSASLLVDPTYVYLPVMITIPYPILTENRRQRPVKIFTLKLSGVLTCFQCKR
jgi:hypothetical protein